MNITETHLIKRKWDMLYIFQEMLNMEQYYTHHFEFTFKNGKRHYCFVGKDNRPYLLSCLKTLSELGLIKKIILGFKTYKWQATQFGIDFYTENEWTLFNLINLFKTHSSTTAKTG